MTCEIAMTYENATFPNGSVIGVETYESDIDGSIVVQIDTSGTPRNLRVYLNDSDEPLFDANPETGEYEGTFPDGD